MPPGTVDNDEDCDDSNPDAFPGAAPNDDRDACMLDADGDDWGDANPPGGGGGGPASGSDCYDTNPLINPDAVQLSVFLPYLGGGLTPRTIETIDINDGSLANFVLLSTPLGGIPDVDISSATFNEDMDIIANDLTGVRLQAVDYADACGMGVGEIEPVGMMSYGPLGNIVCGLEFGDDGQLYGVDSTNDDLRTFDPVTGQVTSSAPIMNGAMLVDVSSCGMARDCTAGRLLMANGVERIIYGIDETTAEAEVLRDLSGFFPSAWLPTGLEYDPVTRTALLSTGNALYRVDINDDSVDPEPLGTFATNVSNLGYLPRCI